MWRHADFHRHSTPNEQSSDEFDPDAFVVSCIADGLDLVAVTDHDHLDHVVEVTAAAQGTKLEVLAGVEATTDRGHILLIAPGSHGLDVLRELTIRLGMRPGSQIRFSDLVAVVKNDSTTSGFAYWEHVVMVGAHVDSKGSLLAPDQPLGLKSQLDAAAELQALEVLRPETLQEWLKAGVKHDRKVRPALIRGSDSHGVGGYLPRSFWLFLPESSPEAVRHAFATPEASVDLSEQRPDETRAWIRSVRFEGGPFDKFQVSFSARMNAIIGPPSSGKSFLIDAIRFAFGDECDIEEVAVTSRQRLDHCLPVGCSVVVEIATSTGVIELRRTRGGAAAARPPFSPVVFSQTELTRRAMSPAPSMSLLDIHCSSVDDWEPAIQAARGAIEQALSRLWKLAENSNKLRAELENEHDGVEATQREFDELAGDEANAIAARDINSIGRWRATLTSAAKNWLAGIAPPSVPTVPRPPSNAISSDHPVLTPADEVKAVWTDYQAKVLAEGERAVERLEELLGASEKELVELRTTLESRLGFGVAEAEQVTGRLADVRDRLEELKEKQESLVAVDQDITDGLSEIDRWIDDAERAFRSRRNARQATCATVNKSMPTFFAKVVVSALAREIDDILEDLKTGTNFRQDTLADIRDTLDRKRLLRFAVRHRQGWRGLTSPKITDTALNQDDVSRQAANRQKAALLAAAATTYPDDGLEISRKQDGAAPAPFRELTEGLRALAIKEISFAEAHLPILTDQPEDAVPTTAVFESLVPTLRKQRAVRQVIVASHDANIVVAGDAERVFVLNDNLGGAPLVGTLFHPDIRARAMELLEGGAAAFQLRMKRYGQ